TVIVTVVGPMPAGVPAAGLCVIARLAGGVQSSVATTALVKAGTGAWKPSPATAHASGPELRMTGGRPGPGMLTPPPTDPRVMVFGVHRPLTSTALMELGIVTPLTKSAFPSGVPALSPVCASGSSAGLSVST